MMGSIIVANRRSGNRMQVQGLSPTFTIACLGMCVKQDNVGGKYLQTWLNSSVVYDHYKEKWEMFIPVDRP